MFIVCWRLSANHVCRTLPMTRADAEQQVREAAMQGVKAWIAPAIWNEVIN